MHAGLWLQQAVAVRPLCTTKSLPCPHKRLEIADAIESVYPTPQPLGLTLIYFQPSPGLEQCIAIVQEKCIVQVLEAQKAFRKETAASDRSKSGHDDDDQDQVRLELLVSSENTLSLT